jgi:amino acid adenylation domain-containing protein
MVLMEKDFMALYRGEQLPSLRVRYRDFSEWRNNPAEREALVHQEAFWLKEFKGNIPALSLPTDYPRPLVQRFEGTRENFVMEAQQWEQLKNLVLKQGVTLYMVLLTIFNVLLAKLSSQEDIVVGTGVEGRRHEDLRQIIGMFVNTLPLRNYPQKEKTFIEFLGEVKERTLVAFENQDYQFEDLVEKVAPDRDTGRNPLFDICFQVENIQASVPATASPGIRAVPHGYKVKISRFDLTLRAGEIKGSLAFSIEYNTSLFKKETIKRFSMYFTRLIASVVSAPGKKLVEIEMIPNNEKEELLFQLNEALDNEVKIIHNKQYNTIQGKLNAALHLCIDHIAIAYGDRYLTYSELDKQSDYIANWMINKGIKCQTYIGLWVDNRMALITTMIGVLKAGCVFTPLDIDQPESKLEMMCRSVNVKYVISDNAAVSQMWEKGFIETHGPEFILWEELFVPTADSDEKPLWYKDTNRPAIQYRGEDQIYIYFTSGTTGTPRAMVGNNRSLLHFIDWEIETLGIKQDYRVSQLTTPGFDAFLRDVLVPLCSGGIICIPKSKDILLDPGALIDWVRKSGIHLIHCVPSVFRLFNSYRLTADDFIELKFILLSGEPIAIPDLVPWYDTFDERIQLVNLWGTSETTLAKTCYFIKKADIHRERIPVGLPIKGARTVILDKGMNICPPLVIGEIYIITPFSTYGYCNDPGLNNEKFLPNPFGTSHKYRMHKTGDLGRLLPDGNLDVLGRIDRQIKVRGIRVELEEIESLLMRHARIKDAVVIKKETDNPNELFYAYVVDSPGPESENEAKVELLGELEVYLAGKLPAYMLPASIIKIERVPRTSRGKVDYDSLPDPLAHKKPGYVAPRDTVEIKLSEIWSEILGIKKPGITSQFFKLGGNSLNIMSLISKIHKEFDVRIPLGDIFNHPTIQKQAEIIKRSTKEKFNPIDASEEKEYYPLSSSQKRMYVVQQLETESKSYNIPTIMVIEGEMDSRRLDRTFRELIKRHDSLRTSFITVEDEPVQKIHPEVTFNVDFYETEYEESQKIVENFIRPFDLTRASLLRAGVIKTDENRYILMVDMYHIISDAVSYEVLVKEFKIFYNGLEPSPLRLQYKDFSGWQDKLFTGGEIKKQEEYWLNRFSGDIPVLDLPTDYPRPAVRNNSAGDLIRFTLDKKLNDSLNRMVNEEETTLYMFLSAVFNILLSKYSKQEDIVVGTPITGRSHADLQDIIGVFLNMLAIRNRPTGNKSFREFLMEVKENALNAFKYSDFPFEELVFKLGVQGDPGRNPLFDAEFAVHSLNISQGSIKGLRVRPYRNENKFAKFDLHFLAVGANNYTTLTIRYSTELYKSSTIEMMKQDYLKILEQVLENPGIRLKDISIGQELLTGKSKISSEAEIGDFVF